MDDVRGALAANLAELRKEENLTQAEFAAQFNYSDKAVSKWERGDSLPDVVMLKTIADLYGLRVDDLLTDGGVAAAYAAATESGGEKQHDAYLMSKVLIAAMWVTMVWVVAVVVFLYS
jgi:Predicted transcriptional regulators